MLNNYKLIAEDQPLLHSPCEKVSKRKGLKVAKVLLKEILDNKPICIGLASNQIGLNYNVAVVQVDTNEPIILINPKIIEKDYPIKAMHEGCMSFPNQQKKVVRYGWIKVDTKLGVYEFGKPKPTFNNYLETIAVQHEIDHLNGLTIMDKCLQPITGDKKPKRNSPCHCGSDNKYKNCCLK